ncbi:uncharacterized protein LOC133909814 [Phragmites australis]|uniref:uncharacterized protein LOC133909814 n=1 Tax=Phragmites australis TaxID=29695 RepID=UPI002D78664F|nr:uncharacterized protein LOC133909814 [Phragmites australis]
MRAKCLKILLLVSLIPLALRASSPLLGHGVPSSSHHQSWTRRRSTTATATGVSVSTSVHKGYHHQTRHRRRMGSSLAAFDTRRLRQDDGDGWFDDEKRLAPVGSNPLHNLR